MTKVLLGPQTLLYPMPAVLVGANVQDKTNFTTIAWCGIVCSDPPTLAVGIRHKRHTLKGIRQTLTFSVNIPSLDLVKEVDYCGIRSGAKVDKVKACHFTVFYGKLNEAPMLEQCPVNLECKVTHILDLGSHALVVGRIEETHVSEDCLTSGKPDVKKIRPIIYTADPASDYRVFGEVVGKAFSAGLEVEKG